MFCALERRSGEHEFTNLADLEANTLLSLRINKRPNNHRLWEPQYSPKRRASICTLPMKKRLKPGIRYSFGRYKNRLVSDAPKTYARWCVRTFLNGLPTEPALWKAILKRAERKDPLSLEQKDLMLTEAIESMGPIKF